MTLSEAIEEVKMHYHDLDYAAEEINDTLDDSILEAIATILNAVVKGELK